MEEEGRGSGIGRIWTVVNVALIPRPLCRVFPSSFSRTVGSFLRSNLKDHI